MISVLDASAAVNVVQGSAKSKMIRNALNEFEYIISPDIFIAEVTNTFWKLHKFKDLPINECEFWLEKSIDLIDNFIESKNVYTEAFALSCNVGHPIYDILYLVTARRHNAVLLSLDEKLKKIAKKQSIKII